MKSEWKKERLNDLCNVEYGTRVVNKRDSGTLFSVYGGGGKTFQVDTYNRENRVVIARFGVSEQVTRFVSGKFFLNDSGLTISPKDPTQLEQKYLDKLMFQLNDQIYGLCRGTAQKNLDVDAFRKLELTYPTSVIEQKRIVSILDDIFKDAEKAKEIAEKNLQNAKELFESYLDNILSNIGKDWETKSLGEITTFSQGIQVGLEKQLTTPKEGYVRFIRIIDYTQNTNDIRYVQNPGSKYFVNEDDIVMVRYGTPGLIGRGKKGVIANNLFKITIEREDLLNDYLCFYLSQKHIQSYLSTRGSTTMPALNFGQIKTVPISFPQMSVQKSIVSHLNCILSETKNLESIYKQKTVNLPILMKSVLSKAFNGEL